MFGCRQLDVCIVLGPVSIQAEEIEEKKKETEGDDVEKKMEVDEDKPTPAPAAQDSSSSQTQKSESASDGPEGTAPVTENADNAEVRSNEQLP
jgi:hypothetical protein